MIKFTPEHEWLKIDGDIATVGITRRGSEQLGDLVFVQLPDIGARFSKGDEIVVVESVKAATDVCCPLDGQISEINHAIIDDPALVRTDPQGNAWFFKLKLANPESAHELLDESAYALLTA